MLDKMKFETKDLTAENVARIAELFPGVVVEGKVNFDLLMSLLGDDVFGREAYEFTWVGKREAIAEAGRSIKKTLRPCVEESKCWDTTENLYIEGDNLDVLKLLQKSYLGKVKMIYIDPPYNTGNDSFIYRDRFTMDEDEYDEAVEKYDENGLKNFQENSTTNPRYHSVWCSMMYPRLVLGRNLLRDDGVIFISIDDNEVAQLRKICDEVFGEGNFVAETIVNRTSEVAAEHTIKQHEYCLCYAKNILNMVMGSNKKYTLSRGTVGNIDQTMPEITFPKGLSCLNINDGVYEKARQIDGSRENIECITPFIVKNGVLVKDVILKARWRSSNDMRNFFNNNCKPTQAKINGVIEEIFFDGDRFMPQIKKLVTEKMETLFLENKKGSKELADLDMKEYFDYPKSVFLIKHFLELFTNSNDIILDFFSGSSTTAHAVMLLNAENDGHRKFIMVQLPEICDEDGAVAKNGYKTICDIGKERIRRAGAKIKSEFALTTPDLDVGFRVLKLDESNMTDVYYNPSNYTQDLIKSMENNIKPDRTDIDLLYGCLLDWGLQPSKTHTQEDIDGFKVHTYNDGDLIACFNEHISEKVIHEIAKRKPERAVFRDSGFTSSSEKINVFEIFKQHLPDMQDDDVKSKVKVI